MSKLDVTVDRDKYIGGSDIPIIMGISPFKTRYQLLLEKAGLAESDFEGNRYTEYGDILEPKIRDYINKKYKTNYQPNKTINGDLRANTDGFNGVSVLEVKTTSQIHDTLEEYKVYLVQLLFYLQENKVGHGLLAVYERPDDFNEEFDAAMLQEFNVDINEHEQLLREINTEIDRFRADLERIKENPLLSEMDLQPLEVIRLSNAVVTLERRMQEFKSIKESYDNMRDKLFDAMKKNGVKTWQMPNGTRITRVDDTPETAKTVEEFDEKAFKKENAALYKAYTKEVVKTTKGRKGFVKITFPEES